MIVPFHSNDGRESFTNNKICGDVLIYSDNNVKNNKIPHNNKHISQIDNQLFVLNNFNLVKAIMVLL